MDSKELKLAKDGIEKKSLKRFQDIFYIVSSNDMADQLHINRSRFRALIKNPFPMRVREIYKVSKILNVQAEQISQMIHYQLENPAKSERAKAK